MHTFQTISNTVSLYVSNQFQTNFKRCSKHAQHPLKTRSKHAHRMIKTLQTHVNTFSTPATNSSHQFDISFGHMLSTLANLFQNNFNTFPKSCLAHVRICFNIFPKLFENGVNTVLKHFPRMFNICSNKCNMSNTAPTHFRICSTYCQHVQHMFNTLAKPLPNHVRHIFKPCSNQFQHRPNTLQHCS